MSFNKVILVGNLGRDPELRYAPSGTPIASFTMATNERRKGKDGGEPTDITTWFRVTVFGRQAENVSQYLTKGRPVYVEGRLNLDEWTDKDGKPRYTLEVTATDVQFLGGGQQAEKAAAAGAGAGGGTTKPAPDKSDDDIPF
jgi:single-strand DNA-binding protein